jgi:uncharacterized protein YndB with AHSA1/START domain
MAAGNAKVTENEIIIERVVNAPRETVFQAWTKPEHLKHWWGPNGFTITTHSMDFRAGGTWKYIMHGPDGVDYDNTISYHEIVLNERLVYAHGGDAQGNEVSFVTKVTFLAQGKQTKVTMHSTFPSAEMLRMVVEKYGAVEGGQQTIGRLGEYAERMDSRGPRTPFFVERTFKAPIALVFEAWTDPKHLRHWMGPTGSKIIEAKQDFKAGGFYHYCMIHPGVGEMWGKMLYREIVKPVRLVYVNCFSNEKGEITAAPFPDPWPREMLTTINFTEHKGWTTVKLEWLPINASDVEWNTFNAGRDGMSQGWGGSFEQLTTYLEGVQK